MSIKEVTRLRKAGQLKEAYELAKQELKADRNVWTVSAMFWVLRDLALCKYLPASDLESAGICVKRMEILLPGMNDEEGIGEKAYQSLVKLLLPHASLIQQAGKLSKTDPTAAYLQVTEALGTSIAAQLDESMHEEFGWIIYRYIKANMETLDSVQVRGLLHDYMKLSNERPSMLHSTILTFAINYSKGHPDFVFYNFLMMWGIDNLREEDFVDVSSDDGHTIPSLVSRICKALVESPALLDVQTLVSNFKPERQPEVLEHLRISFFWKLMNQHKNGDTGEALCAAFEHYADLFTSFPGSHWHSEILKMANRYIPDECIAYFTLVRKWYSSGNFLPEDWEKTVAEDGREYPSLVVKTAKRCYEILRMSQQLYRDTDQIIWLKSLYRAIYERDSADDWSIRNYASLCKLTGDLQETVDIYKKLLLDMGEKYYLWSELAACIQNDNPVKTGLLLKALRLERNEDFLGNIHLSLAEAWIQEGFGTNARAELHAYNKHRTEKGWNVSDVYHRLEQQLVNVPDAKCDQANRYILQAEDFVYSAYAWKDFVLTDRWVHNGTERCNFSDGQSLTFSVKTKRFPVLHKAQSGDILGWRYCLNDPAEIKPLVLRKRQLPKWSLFPLSYGVVDYVNVQKKTLHIITQDNQQVFVPLANNVLQAGDWVRFRQYAKNTKNGQIMCVVDLQVCLKDEALPHMPGSLAGVDDVNEEKQLIHIILWSQHTSCSVKFAETSLRPQVGEFLYVHYYLAKSKGGNTRLKILDLQPTDEKQEGVKKQVRGMLSLKYKDNNNSLTYPDFAFVNGHYVHQKLLRKYQITSDCEVIASLILDVDKKWKVYGLKLVSADA